MFGSYQDAIRILKGIQKTAIEVVENSPEGGVFVHPDTQRALHAVFTISQCIAAIETAWKEEERSFAEFYEKQGIEVDDDSYADRIDCDESDWLEGIEFEKQGTPWEEL